MAADLRAGPKEERHRLYSELWISFVALIRSYAAAQDFARPAAIHTRVHEEGTGHLTVCSGSRTLEMGFDAATGSGSWAVYEGEAGRRTMERGNFEIGEDSRIAMSDSAGRLELEVAAEAFSAKVF